MSDARSLISRTLFDIYLTRIFSVTGWRTTLRGLREQGGQTALSSEVSICLLIISEESSYSLKSLESP